MEPDSAMEDDLERTNVSSTTSKQVNTKGTLKDYGGSKQSNNKRSIGLINSHEVSSLERNVDLFVCQKCGKTAKTKQALERHAAYHEDDRPFACEMCQQRFKNSDDRGKHYRRLKKDGKFEYACTACHKHFKSDILLKKHQVMLGCLSGLSDDIVKQNAQNASEELQEIISQIKPPNDTLDDVKPVMTCRCKCCELDFENAKLLKSHYKHYHKDLKRQVCIQCGQTLSSRDSLNRHYNIFHQQEFAYPCSQCDQKFKIKESLYRHIKFVHTDGGYPCPICQHVFSQPVNLRKHMLVHTAQKEHVCEICGKAFKWKQGLQKHSSVHIHSEIKSNGNEDIAMDIAAELDESSENIISCKNGHLNHNEEERLTKTTHFKKGNDAVETVKAIKGHEKRPGNKCHSTQDTVIEKLTINLLLQDDQLICAKKKKKKSSIKGIVSDVNIKNTNHHTESIDMGQDEVVEIGMDADKFRNLETERETLSEHASITTTNIDENLAYAPSKHGMVLEGNKAVMNLESFNTTSKRSHKDSKIKKSCQDHGASKCSKQTQCVQNKKDNNNVCKVDPQVKNDRIQAFIDNLQVHVDEVTEDQNDSCLNHEPFSPGNSMCVNDKTDEATFNPNKDHISRLRPLRDAVSVHECGDKSSTKQFTNNEIMRVDGLAYNAEGNNESIFAYNAEELKSSKVKNQSYVHNRTDVSSEEHKGCDIDEEFNNSSEKTEIYSSEDKQKLIPQKQSDISNNTYVYTRTITEGAHDSDFPDSDMTTSHSNKHFFKPSSLPFIMSTGDSVAFSRTTRTDRNETGDEEPKSSTTVTLPTHQINARNPCITENDRCNDSLWDSALKGQASNKDTTLNLNRTETTKQAPKTTLELPTGKFSLIKHMLSLQNEDHFDKSLFENPLYNKPAQIHDFRKMAEMHKISNGKHMEEYDLSAKQNIPLHWLCLRRSISETKAHTLSKFTRTSDSFVNLMQRDTEEAKRVGNEHMSDTSVAQMKECDVELTNQSGIGHKQIRDTVVKVSEVDKPLTSRSGQHTNESDARRQFYCHAEVEMDIRNNDTEQAETVLKNTTNNKKLVETNYCSEYYRTNDNRTSILPSKEYFDSDLSGAISSHGNTTGTSRYDISSTQINRHTTWNESFGAPMNETSVPGEHSVQQSGIQENLSLKPLSTGSSVSNKSWPMSSGTFVGSLKSPLKPASYSDSLMSLSSSEAHTCNDKLYRERWHPYKAMKSLVSRNKLQDSHSDCDTLGASSASIFSNPLDMTLKKHLTERQEAHGSYLGRTKYGIAYPKSTTDVTPGTVRTSAQCHHFNSSEISEPSVLSSSVCLPGPSQSDNPLIAHNQSRDYRHNVSEYHIAGIAGSVVLGGSKLHVQAGFPNNATEQYNRFLSDSRESVQFPQAKSLLETTCHNLFAQNPEHNSQVTCSKPCSNSQIVYSDIYMNTRVSHANDSRRSFINRNSQDFRTHYNVSEKSKHHTSAINLTQIQPAFDISATDDF